MLVCGAAEAEIFIGDMVTEARRNVNRGEWQLPEWSRRTVDGRWWTVLKCPTWSAWAGGIRRSVRVVSHERIIEAGLVTCLPQSNSAGWGAALRHREGARLQYEAGRFTQVSWLIYRMCEK